MTTKPSAWQRNLKKLTVALMTVSCFAAEVLDFVINIIDLLGIAGV